MLTPSIYIEIDKKLQRPSEVDTLLGNCNKAKKKLKWKSILNIKQTIKLTTNWYKTFYTNSQEIKKLSIDQIKFYENLMKKKI